MVMPTEIMPLIEDWRRMLRALDRVRNWSERAVSAMDRIAKAMTSPNLWKKTLTPKEVLSITFITC